jgi:hypothetical protein
MRSHELSPKSGPDPVLERREQAAADLVKVLTQVRAELARAQALLARIARERSAKPVSADIAQTFRVEQEPLQPLAPQIERTLANTLFEPRPEQ